MYLNTSYRVLITNNIFSHDSGFGIGGGADKLYPSCNLYDGNVRGPSQAHALTPTEVDGPALFCAPEAGIFALCTNSPALAANNVCGLMGASDETCGACGPVAVEDQAWGTVKSMFR